LVSAVAVMRRVADPVELRHPDVHQHHVRLLGVHEGDRLMTRGSLADDGEVGCGREDAAQPGAHEFLVVGDGYAQGHHVARASHSARPAGADRAASGRRAVTWKPPPAVGAAASRYNHMRPPTSPG
jgi:hypothetical protein